VVSGMALGTLLLVWVLPQDNTFSALMAIFIGTLLFGGLYSLIFSFIKILRRRPVLLIDEHGFSELLELEPVGRIPWGYVSSCQLMNSKTGKTLAVYLKDYDFVLGKFQGYERMHMTRALSFYGTFIFIPCKNLSIRPKELFTLFDDRIYNPDGNRAPQNLE